VELRRRYGSFAFPATIAFMAWYLLYVICANWARASWTSRLSGTSTSRWCGAAAVRLDLHDRLLLRRHAKRSLDPLASKLRDEFEQETGR
jgi:uncharacterized membrane protein (DUF485 family)